MTVISKVSNFHGFLSLEQEWNSLLKRSVSNSIFLSHEWFKCWWEAYGGEYELFILLCKDEGRLIGISPLMMSKDRLRGFPVKKISFIESSINHSTFIGMDLTGIKILNSSVQDVDFREADLSKADFSGSDLTKSIFGKTILSGADLRRARNYHINPCLNKLTGAKFAMPEALALLYSMDILLDADM